MKLYKNPDWSDQQRERSIQRRIDELYDKMVIKWGNTSARTVKQKLVDTLEDLRPGDEATTVIIWSVVTRDITGQDYPVQIIADDDAKKYRQKMALDDLAGRKSEIIHDEKLWFVAPIGIKRRQSKSNDEEIHWFDAKSKKADQDMVAEWSEIRENDNNTRARTISIVKSNSKKSDQERSRLKREEIARRKRKATP